MPHQYNAGDVVTVFQISPSNELVIEGKATIRKRVAEVDEHYRVEFANKPGATCQRFVDSWGQDDPEKYVVLVPIPRHPRGWGHYFPNRVRRAAIAQRARSTNRPAAQDSESISALPPTR